MAISSELRDSPLVRNIVDLVPENKVLPFAIAALCILVATRVFSSTLGESRKTPNGVNTVPMPPYWLPVVGHIANFLLYSEGFLPWARKKYTSGIFALNLGGSSHNIICKPELSGVFMNVKNEIGDASHITKGIMLTNFAFPRSESKQYDEALPDLLASYKYLTSNPGLSDMVNNTISVLKRNINDLVSFSESVVDQPQWERMADTFLVTKPNGETVVEASLLPLARNFIAMTATPSLFGTDFINNNLDFWSYFWVMDSAFGWLATGLPRWLPVPKLTRGHIALRSMMQAFTKFETALEIEATGGDPGSDWTHLEDVGPLIKHRTAIYQKHGMSIKARASIDAALVWAMNANANQAVFWLINQAYADDKLLDELRKEVAPFVHIAHIKQEFPIPELPRLDGIDLEGLETKCPLLKSAYIEVLRHDVASWSPKLMKQDYVLSSRDKSAEKFLLKKGTYAHVAHELHHKDPACWVEPEVWKADRHVIYKTDDNGEKYKTADMGTVRPYGGGHNMCKGRAFAVKEIMLFTAVIITFWDIEPAGGGPWKMPRPVRAAGTNGAKDDVRVWMKRRQF